ncbi:MAG: hypothetical protein B9S33_13050 [Pedosphaera sp. Tous-C6FEB]|nr:MAG: hypothetical protein B9S33_13050 [Pedosphaera sp. Tous-C6FEB]
MNAKLLGKCVSLLGVCLLLQACASTRGYDVSVVNLSDRELRDVDVRYPGFRFPFGYSAILSHSTFGGAEAPLPDRATIRFSSGGRAREHEVDFSAARKTLQGFPEGLHFVIRGDEDVVGKIASKFRDESNFAFWPQVFPDQTDPKFVLYRKLGNAADTGNRSKAEQLLGQGAPLEWDDPKPSVSPLEFACLRGHREVVRLLLANGAEKMSPKRLSKAWRLGLQSDSIDIARDVAAVIPAGGFRQHDLKEAVYAAAGAGNVRGAAYLFEERKLNINLQTSDVGHTALYSAVQHRQLAFLRYLLPRGADPNVSVMGKSALAEAEKRGFGDVATLLREHGAK